VLVNVTGGLDMTLLEVDEAANAISNEVDPDANIIFGAAFDPALDGKIRVSVVATGMEGPHAQVQPAPRSVTRLSDAATLQVPQAAPARTQAQAQAQAHAHSYGQLQAPTPVAEPAPVAANAESPEFMAVEAEELPIAASDTAPSQGELLAAESPISARPAQDDQPLFPEPRHDDRKKGGGFFSLFGGRKPYEPAPAPTAAQPGPAPRGPQPLPTRGNAALAQQPDIDPDMPESPEDLDIPSFLRRLAN